MSWKDVTLKDVCDRVQYGYTASASTDSTGPKFLRITDIVPESVDWRNVPHCEINNKNLEKYLLQEGDIVVARTGATTGYAKQLKNPPRSVFASYLVRFQPNREVDSDFIGHVVQSATYKQFIKRNVGGAAQPNANAQVLGSFPFKLPPLDIQQKIASILSAYVDLIENNTRRIEILEEMARRLYEEWFVHFRFPGHEEVSFKESELGEIPEGWKIANLEEVVNLTMGQSPKSEFYNDRGEGLPFHQGVTDFGNYFPSNRLYCTVENRIAEEGDILFSVRAPVGRINISKEKIVIGRGVSALRSKSDHQVFLLSQLRKIFEEEDSIGNGAIFKAVTKKDMQSIKLLQPDSRHIEGFESIAGSLWKQIRVLSDKNNNLRVQRDLLLPKLVSGEIDVSDITMPEDEEVEAA